MSAIYDNWERLVAAVIKKQQFWELCHDHSRTPSLLSEASDFSCSFNLSSPPPDDDDQAFDFARLRISSWSDRLIPKLVFISEFDRVVDVENRYQDSAVLLGSGNFGSAYVAGLENLGMFVVKRLKSMSISQADFERQMNIVGSIRHENVVALRAYYSSEDEKLLMYDYYKEGSVYALLHGQNGESPAYVPWDTRLRTAIGAARGIAEIHRHSGGKLVHGNIKASNIFLNSQKFGCVSDLGVTKLIQINLMPGAHCYAPEVKNRQNASQASDVYSFGILLLELLTGKTTVDVPGGPEAVNLVKLINSLKTQERIAKLFDVNLLKFSTVKDEMTQMLEIGIKCVEKSVKNRPNMSELVVMLENISGFHPMINATQEVKPSNAIEEEKPVVIKDANHTFDPLDMLRAFVEILGKGTLGTSYMAELGNGKTIVVKRLSDVIVTFEDFRQHMKVIGRMRHKNICDVRVYYFSNDEKLLVYDYHDQGSLSAWLHGNRRLSLDWETRLKIAVSAARGIAHIHKQDNGKLVHGNIKSSNIFLNEQKESIICDTGLAKLTSPIKLSHILNRAYCAPEVKDTSNVSQASDVYSFGVVLLEILSRKPSQCTEDNDKVISLVEWVRSFVRDERASELLHGVLRDGEEEKMLWLLQKAMYCVSIDREKRPRMYEVVMMLEEISGDFELTNEPSVESRLESLLETLLPTMAP